MANLFDKMKSIFTVDYDEYEDDYYDDFDEEVEVEKEKELVRKPATFRRAEPKEEVVEERKPSLASRQPRTSRSSKVVPMRSSDMEVCVVKPTYFESSKEIVDLLLEGKAVVLNLEGIKIDLAQRIIDMISGGCYALHGNLQKISGYIYLVTPRSVEITGDFQELFGDGTGLNNSFDRRTF